MINLAFTPIGDANNPSDANGYGSVGYSYAISKYEINLAQYVEFLNAVAATPSASYITDLYSEDMNDDDYVIENTIARTGSGTDADPFVYAVASGPADPDNVTVKGSTPLDPVPFVDWFDVARFINWLHNGTPTGASALGSTEDGAYTLNGATSGVIVRNPGATFWLPTEDEWYKAAYYDPSLNDGAGGYWTNATRSDVLPAYIDPPGSSNAANFNGLRPEQYKLIDTGSYALSPSAYGTFDQAGNLWEWTGTNIFENYVVRGGSWSYGLTTVESTQRRDYKTDYNDDDTGFRIATAVSPYVDLGTLETPALIYSMTAYEQISALYLGLLGREADDTGFQFWLTALASASNPTMEDPSSALVAWDALANQIGQSAEAQSTFAALASPSQATIADIEAFIQSVHEAFFSRSADQASLDFWVDRFQVLAAGGQAVGSIVVEMIESTNNVERNADHVTVIRQAALGIPQADAVLTADLPVGDSMLDPADSVSDAQNLDNSLAMLNPERQPGLDMAFTPVLNAGNPTDDTGYGSVAYNYSIGKYEVTIGQYVAFLNAVLTLDPDASQAYLSDLYNAHYMSGNRRFQDTVDRGGSGTEADPYVYTVSGESMPSEPMPWVTWYSAARYVNWLHNGADSTASTESGAYDLNGAVSGIFTRTADAKFWLPSENEWYKAAYFDTQANDGAGAYWNIATGSNAYPEAVAPFGGMNAANYNDTLPAGDKLTTVGAYTYSPSSYGTYDQAGNLWEFLEASYEDNHIVRGGSWSYGYTPIENTTRRDYVPQYLDDDTGFRIATQISPYAVVETTTGLMSQYALTGHEQISILYQGLLGRDADGEGYHFWLSALGTQTPEDSLDMWVSIANEIGASTEAQGRYAALANPKDATEAEIGSFLDDVYEALFSRAADETGLQAWTDVFEAKADQGNVGSIVVDMAASTYLSMASADDHLMLAYNAATGIPELFAA